MGSGTVKTKENHGKTLIFGGPARQNHGFREQFLNILAPSTLLLSDFFLLSAPCTVLLSQFFFAASPSTVLLPEFFFWRPAARHSDS